MSSIAQKTGSNLIESILNKEQYYVKMIKKCIGNVSRSLIK